MAKIKVVDVSKWNPYYDPVKMKDVGCTQVIIRAGYGNGNIDPYAVSHYEKSVAAGFDIGFYWFSYAGNADMARKEARHLLEFVKDKKVTMPLVFDFEGDSMRNKVISRKTVNQLGKAFLSEIEQAGYYAMLYANQDFLNRFWDIEIQKKYDIWYARYTLNEKYAKPYYLWQYTSSFKIEGKNYDMSIAKRDYPAVIKKAGLNHIKG